LQIGVRPEILQFSSYPGSSGKEKGIAKIVGLTPKKATAEAVAV